MRWSVALTMLASVGWFAGSTRYYVCHIKGLCRPSTADTTYKANIPTVPALYFQPRDSALQQGPTFPAFLDSILSTRGSRAILIPAIPADSADAPYLFDARSRSLTAFWQSKLGEQCAVLPEQAERVENTSYIPATQIRWADADSGWVQLGEVLMVFFPINSTRALPDAELAEALPKWIRSAQANGSTFQVTGHTDASGSPTVNKRLGWQRAAAVADRLNSLGVARGRIRVESLGASKPIALNDTEAGRSRNRRVEVRILPTEN